MTKYYYKKYRYNLPTWLIIGAASPFCFFFPIMLAILGIAPWEFIAAAFVWIGLPGFLIIAYLVMTYKNGGIDVLPDGVSITDWRGKKHDIMWEEIMAVQEKAPWFTIVWRKQTTFRKRHLNIWYELLDKQSEKEFIEVLAKNANLERVGKWGLDYKKRK